MLIVVFYWSTHHNINVVQSQAWHVMLFSWICKCHYSPTANSGTITGHLTYLTNEISPFCWHVLSPLTIEHVHLSWQEITILNFTVLLYGHSFSCYLLWTPSEEVDTFLYKSTKAYIRLYQVSSEFSMFCHHRIFCSFSVAN